MTSSSVSTNANASVPSWTVDVAQDAWNYWVDAWQRQILFLDVLGQRSARYEEHKAKTAPHVLKFGCELIMDGRKLPRPVNYALVRIVPPKGEEADKYKRPFVVVDPRAGHGPGLADLRHRAKSAWP